LKFFNLREIDEVLSEIETQIDIEQRELND